MKKNLLLFKMIFMMGIFIGIFVFDSNATVTPVSSGSATLSAAVTAAISGDTLEISGDITETGDISFTKSLTIRAASGLPAKPKVTMKRLLLNGADINVSVSGIEFIGASGAAEFVDVGSAITMKNLKISNCVIHNYTRGFRFTRNLITIDTFLVEKCLFYEEAYTTVTYPVFNFAATNKPVFKSIIIKNSTFYNNGCTFMIVPQAAPASDSTRILFDHNTIYNAVYQEATTVRYFIIANAITAVNLRLNFSNNIVCKLADPTKALPFSIANIKAVFNNNSFYNFNGPVWANNLSNLYTNPAVTIALSDTITDPLFKDAANADFTLPAGSKLLTFGSDGKAIGDPRWATNVTKVYKAIQAPVNITNKNGNIDILSEKIISTVTVTDIKGIQKYNQKVNNNHTIINTANWSSGIYIISIRSNNTITTKKISIVK